MAFIERDRGHHHRSCVYIVYIQNEALGGLIDCTRMTMSGLRMRDIFSP